MNTTRKRTLFISLTLLFVMACRTYACSAGTSVDVAELGLDATLMDCQMFFQTPDDEGHTRGYTCQIICPDGEGYYALDIYEHPNISFAGMTYHQLQERYCPASSSEPSSSTLLPTATSTVIPTPTKGQPVIQPTAIQPFLSGKFTACDLSKGYINFLQHEPKLDITGKKVVLTMNGTAANCSIPASNSGLYSCALPAGLKFPAEIIVTMNGTEINKFSIDGAVCVTSVPTKDEVEVDATQGPEPTPTIDPND